jgi:hypothetical protein
MGGKQRHHADGGGSTVLRPQEKVIIKCSVEDIDHIPKDITLYIYTTYNLHYL